MVAPLKRLRGSSCETPVYVCEYHSEALRCLHHAIRHKRLPFEGVTMVHLDAHPDLSGSSTMPAQTVFDSPFSVYEALASDSSGIAQWILPAVYGGHLRCVWWVRPSFSGQIRDGDYNIAVGRATRPPGDDLKTRECKKPASEQNLSVTGDVVSAVDVIMTSCSEPYFVEDGLYCEVTKLIDPKPLRLLVSEAPSSDHVTHGEDLKDPWCLHTSDVDRWTLDVCLDYFACGNPFLTGVRPSVAAPCAAVQNMATFRATAVQDVPRFLADAEAFDVAYTAVLKDSLANVHREASDGPDGADTQSDALLDSLGTFLPAGRQESMLDDLQTALETARESELLEILKAGDMVSLPLQPVVRADVEARLASFDGFLEQLCKRFGPPAAVTIARSVVDGFCPMRWLCELESGTLDVLRRHLGEIQLIYSDELDSMEHV